MLLTLHCRVVSKELGWRLRLVRLVRLVGHVGQVRLVRLVLQGLGGRSLVLQGLRRLAQVLGRVRLHLLLLLVVQALQLLLL